MVASLIIRYQIYVNFVQLNLMKKWTERIRPTISENEIWKKEFIYWTLRILYDMDCHIDICYRS